MPTPTATITGLLLAAGAGERFGGAKLLARLPGGPHAGQAVGAVAAQRLLAVLPGSIAVLRPGDVALRDVIERTGMRVVECTDAGSGMGASLACGVRAAAAADGWVVALADMPWIAATTIAAVAGRLRAGHALVAPQFRGQRGHPVGFAATWRADLLALHGDAGARELLARHGETVTLVDVDDGGILRDVDYPADLRDENPQQ